MGEDDASRCDDALATSQALEANVRLEQGFAQLGLHEGMGSGMVVEERDQVDSFRERLRASYVAHQFVLEREVVGNHPRRLAYGMEPTTGVHALAEAGGVGQPFPISLPRF